MLLGAVLAALLLLHSPRLRHSCLPWPCSPASESPLDRQARSSGDRRRVAFHAVREHRVPPADPATVGDGRAGEAQRGLVWVWVGPDVVPIEDEFAERRVPVRARGCERRLSKAFLRRVCVGGGRRPGGALRARAPPDPRLPPGPPRAPPAVPGRRARPPPRGEGHPPTPPP